MREQKLNPAKHGHPQQALRGRKKTSFANEAASPEKGHDVFVTTPALSKMPLREFINSGPTVDGGPDGLCWPIGLPKKLSIRRTAPGCNLACPCLSFRSAFRAWLAAANIPHAVNFTGSRPCGLLSCGNDSELQGRLPRQQQMTTFQECAKDKHGVSGPSELCIISILLRKHRQIRGQELGLWQQKKGGKQPKGNQRRSEEGP